MKAVLNSGQDLVLIQLRGVLVVVCSVTAVNRELGKKDENLQSLCGKIDSKAKIQAVRKKEKRSFDIIFLLCVQSEQNETEIDANSLNLLFLLQKWVLFLTIQPLEKSVKSLHCKRRNTSHQRGGN